MTPEALNHEAAKLRSRLVADLTKAGHLRSKQWQAALDDVPRHEFVPEFLRLIEGSSPTRWEPISPGHSGRERWLELAYADESLVTQLDGHLGPTDAVIGNPTSSSTMPSLVVQMWEDLDVQDSNRVLEIGTGTGYSTALGCHRLGEDNITSVEVDPDVAQRARQALARVGYQPHLVVGDGEDGAAGDAPYDRIIATCSFRHVPKAWVEQSIPGTVILVTLSGWLGGTGLAKLTVTGDGSAEGWFLPGYVSFMPARAHSPGPVTIPDLDDSAAPGPTSLGPDAITAYGPAQLVAQLAVPEAQYLQFGSDDRMPEHLLIQPDDSYAAFTGRPGDWMVQQGGPERIWNTVEAALTTWRAAGEPGIETFQITVTPDGQMVHFGSEEGWRLP